MRRLFGLLVASLLVLVVSTGTAAAHAKLEAMTPADGSTSAAPPTKVTLRVNEPVSSTGAEVVVKSPKGTNVATGKIDVVDNFVTQPVDGLVDVGKYTVTARIVSVDGHPITVGGSFTITHAGHPPTPAAPVAASPPTADSGSNVVVIVAAVLVMLVVVALAVVIVRRRPAPQ